MDSLDYTPKTPEEKEVSLQVDLNKLPHHIAIIMDGNGRWAKLKGFKDRIKCFIDLFDRFFAGKLPVVHTHEFIL